MGKTFRNTSQMNKSDYFFNKRNKNGKIRDGTPTKYSGSCENNGGCPYCEDNRRHSERKRKDKANFSFKELDIAD